MQDLPAFGDVEGIFAELHEIPSSVEIIEAADGPPVKPTAIRVRFPSEETPFHVAESLKEAVRVQFWPSLEYITLPEAPALSLSKAINLRLAA